MTQLPFASMLPTTSWVAPRVADLPSWRGARRVCVDVETFDPMIQRDLGIGVRHGGYIVGVSFALEDGPAHYLPVRHEGGGNLDPAQVLAYLRDQARDYEGEIVGANLGGYDLDYLEEEGVTFPKVSKFRDVLVASPILDQLEPRHSLEDVLGRHGLPGKEEDQLKAALAYYGHGKGNLWRLHASQVGAYAEGDARKPLPLLLRMEKRIIADDLWKVWDLESDVLPVLVAMRRRGVAVDLDRVRAMEQRALIVIADCLAKVRHLTGVSLHEGDLDKSAALAPALLKVVGDLPRTSKGKWSVTKDVLAGCGEVGAAIMRAREWHKLKNTFCASIWTYQVNGRIHCTYRGLKGAAFGDDDEERGTSWGRTSCIHPNLSQQPDRNPEFGKAWRSIYRAEPGTVWVCSDWSQQEPRWAVHYAELLGCTGAKEFADRYRADPSLDIHQAITDIVNEASAEKFLRGAVKQHVNGRIYALGDTKLCWKLGWPTEMGVNWKGEPAEVPTAESAAKIARINAAAPWLREFGRHASRAARRRGWVRTAYGRLCRFPRDEHGNVEWVHKAGNRVGQGTAGDQCKLALVRAHRAGIPLQLTVYDEFDFSCAPNLRQARELAEIQLTALPCRVPHLVDTEVGPSWGELQKVAKVYGENWGRA